MEAVTEKTVGYQEFKQALDLELQKAAEGFVKIGFLLRMAMETEILKESGYRDVYEFADREYNLDKSQVSRFININIKFSEGGYSGILKDQYRGYGYAKLAVMLQLPDVILEELSPAFTKSEIQTIHEEIKEEKKTSDIEVWLEDPKPEQAVMDSSLAKVIHQLCRTNPEIYKKLHARRQEENTEIVKREFQGVLAPAGEAIYSVRIQGEGRMMLSVKGMEQPVNVIHVRSNEKESFPWQDLIDAFQTLCHGGPWEQDWEITYGEELPGKQEESLKKEEVAPVQQKETPAPRKQAKVTAAKPEPKKEEPPKPAPEQEEKKPEQVAEEPKQNTEESEQNAENPDQNTENQEQDARSRDQKPAEPEREQTQAEQEPRQTSIETDFQEVLPDGYEIGETLTETEHWEAIASCINQFNRELSWPECDRDLGALMENAKEIITELGTIRKIRGGE